MDKPLVAHSILVGIFYSSFGLVALGTGDDGGHLIGLKCFGYGIYNRGWARGPVMTSMR